MHGHRALEVIKRSYRAAYVTVFAHLFHPSTLDLSAFQLSTIIIVDAILDSAAFAVFHRGETKIRRDSFKLAYQCGREVAFHHVTSRSSPEQRILSNART